MKKITFYWGAQHKIVIQVTGFDFSGFSVKTLQIRRASYVPVLFEFSTEKTGEYELLEIAPGTFQATILGSMSDNIPTQGETYYAQLATYNNSNDHTPFEPFQVVVLPAYNTQLTRVTTGDTASANVSTILIAYTSPSAQTVTIVSAILNQIAIEASNTAVAASGEAESFRNEAEGFSEVASGAAGAAAGSAVDATNKAGEALESANIATTKAGEAATSESNAAISASIAAAAQRVYINTTAGLAATTSGQYFYVPVSGSNTLLTLYLNNAGSAVTIGDYPSRTLVEANKKDLELYSKIIATTSGQAVNSGTINTTTDQITIPNGVTGYATFLRKTINIAAQGWAVGNKIQFIAIVQESVAGSADGRITFGLNKTNNGSAVNGVQQNVATPVRISSTQVRYYFDYTIVSLDTDLSPFVQSLSLSTNSSGGALVFTWQSLNASNSNGINPISKLTTVNDAIIAQGVMLAGNIDAKTVHFTAATNGFTGQVFNGGVRLNGRITAPTGQTGQTSFATLILPQANFVNWSDMVGKPITFTMFATTSSGLLSARSILGQLNVIRGGVTVTGQASGVTITAVSSTIARLQFTYTPQAGDESLRPYLQFNDAVTATSDQFFELGGFFYSMSPPSGYPTENTYPFTKFNDFLTAQTASLSSQISGKTVQFSAAYSSYLSAAFNGATVIQPRVTVPVGQTGNTSYTMCSFQSSRFANYTDMVGKSVTFSIYLNTSASILSTRTFNTNMHVIRNGVQQNNVAGGQALTAVSSTLLLYQFTYTVQAGDTDFRPYVQFSNAFTVTGSDQFIEMLGPIFYTVTTPAGYPSDNTYWGVKTYEKIATIENTVANGATIVTLTVNRDGSGQYATPKLANDAITDSGPLKWYVILFDGTYTDIGWTLKPFTILRGRNKDTSILRGELPDSATDAQITPTSTIDIKKTSYLENLTITARNMRYAVHSEESGANPDAVHNVYNCNIIHFGNQGARDWRNANPGSGMLASTVWSSDRPWGYGSASGMLETYTNSVFIAQKEAYYVHNNKDFTKPNINVLQNCRLVMPSFRAAVVVQSLGSGTRDVVDIRNTSITPGWIRQDDNPWITEDPLKQYANHAEHDIIVANSSPIGYADATRGRALRIESNSTGSASKVEVSGAAATAIFGTVYTRTLGYGVKSYVYGHWDISGILVGIGSNITANNTLGRRLGDCSTVSKTLTVTVDGGTPVNIVFNTNLTAVNNATIIATINAAFGSAAVASEYNSAAGEYYPSFCEKELSIANTSTVTIPRFGAVAYNTDGSNIRLCNTSDPVSAFVGFALEPIPPGATGRVLREGILSKSQLGYSGSVSFGTALSLSSTVAGAIEAGAAKQVLTGIATDWLQFKGN